MDFSEEKVDADDLDKRKEAEEASGEESTEESTPGTEQNLAEKLKGKFKKKDKDNALEEAKAELEAENDRYLRLNAEFQNFKKRVEKEKADIVKFANERLLTDFLAVLDNMDRALESCEKSSDEKLKEGLGMIKKSLEDVLSKNGVEEIKAKGAEFDPELHHAVMTEEVEGTEDGIVLDVLQTGYKLNGRVIRPSMVKVSK